MSCGPTKLDEYIQYVCGLSYGGGGGIQPTSLYQDHANNVLRLPVDRQRPHHQVRTKN